MFTYLIIQSVVSLALAASVPNSTIQLQSSIGPFIGVNIGKAVDVPQVSNNVNKTAAPTTKGHLTDGVWVQ